MPIPKIIDPAIAEIKRIVENELAVACSFIYAGEFESNVILDQGDEKINFPVFIMMGVAKNKNKLNEAHLVVRKLPVHGFFLNAAEDLDTVDIKAIDANPMMNQMRMLAENFVWHLNQSELSVGNSDKDDFGIDEWTSEDVYEKFDAHLFGQEFQGEWVVRTGTSGYYDNA